MTEQPSSSIPTKHKAWVVVRKGVPAKALELKETDVPKLINDEVLIKVQAGALNPVYASSREVRSTTNACLDVGAIS